MKTKSYIIIIFLCLIFLTGCDKKDDNLNKQIKYINQINRLDKEYFTLYEQLSGIELSKQKILTKTEENIMKQPKEDENQDIQADKSDEEDIVEIVEIEQRDSMLEAVKEPNWKNSKELCEQLQDCIIDIQVEMGNNNVDEQIINEYKLEFDNLINGIVKQDKEKSIIALSNLFIYSEIFVERCVNIQELLLIKQTYYSSMKSLIFLELEDTQDFEQELQKLKININEINNNFNYKEIEYVKKRISSITATIDSNYKIQEKENTRLKLVMLIETIPSAESYIQKLTIK